MRSMRKSGQVTAGTKRIKPASDQAAVRVRMRVARRADHIVAPQRVQSAPPRVRGASIVWTSPHAGQPICESAIDIVFFRASRRENCYGGESTHSTALRDAPRVCDFFVCGDFNFRFRDNVYTRGAVGTDYAA
jgi:hypothetical protein